MIYQSLWVMEVRNRTRKNGKWTEWVPVRDWSAELNAYTVFPAKEGAQETYYERRAVEYVRKEPEATK